MAHPMRGLLDLTPFLARAASLVFHPKLRTGVAPIWMLVLLLPATALAQGTVTATDGDLEDRVEITWNLELVPTDLVQLERDGTLLNIIAPSENTYNDRTAVPGVTYTYCAIVEHSDGSVEPAVCDTGSRELARPTGFAASDGTDVDEVVLTWADRSEVEDGYLVRRSSEQALQFDGTTDHTVTASAIDLSGSFTLAFRARRTINGTTDAVISHGTSPDYAGFQIGFDSANRFFFWFRNDVLSTTTTYTDTDWHHYAVSYDAATRTRTLYVDGILRVSDVAGQAYTGLGPLYMGRLSWGSANFFAGELDEVRLWSTARTAGQIAAGTTALLSGLEPDLASYWPLDAGTGTTAFDIQGGNHAAFVDMDATAWIDAPTFELTALLAPNMSAYADQTAVPGVIYTYTLAAAQDPNRDGRFTEGTDYRSAFATDTGWRAFVTPPGKVMATDGQFDDRVRITWVDRAEGEDLFRIFRDDVEIGTVTSGDATQFDDLTAAAMTVYTYCVTAEAAGVASTKVCDEGMAGGLAAPAMVAASDSTFDDRVQITWDDVAPTEDGFIILRGGTPIDTTAANITLFNDFAATPAVTASYCVQAISQAKPESPSTSTQVCDDGYRAPVLAPTNVVASDDDFENGVQLTWSNPSTTVSLFKVYRDDVLIQVLAPAMTTMVDEAIASDVVYTYGVEAVTVIGASAALEAELTDMLAALHAAPAAEPSQRLSEAPLAGPFQAATPQLAAIEQLLTKAQAEGVETSARVEDTGNRSIAPPTNLQATDDAFEDHVKLAWQSQSDVAEGFIVQRGTGLVLDSTDAYADLPDVFTDETDFTFEAWVFWYGGSPWQPIAFFGQDTDTYMYLTPQTGTSGNIRFAMRAPSIAEQQLNGAAPLPERTWVHVAVTLEGDIGTLYVDGRVQESRTIRLTPAEVVGANQWLGRDGSQFNNPAFKGILRDVRLWSVARSQDDVLAQMSRRLTGTEPGLLAYWPLDETPAPGATQNGSTTRELVAGQDAILQSGARLGEELARISANRTSYADYAAPSGLTVPYAVRVFDSYGVSVAGVDDGQRTLAAPTRLRASDGTSETEVTLTWTDNARAEDGYRIYREPLDGTPTTLVGTVVANQTMFTDDQTLTGGTLGAPYRYVVAAFDAAGTSAAATDPGQTDLLAPTNLNASTQYDDQVVLGWTDASAQESGYRVQYIDQAMVADGDDSIQDTGAYDNTYASTSLSAWFQTTGSGLSNSIVLLLDVSVVPTVVAHILVDQGRLLSCFNTSETCETHTTLVNDGAWHHVTATGNAASGTIDVYLDGELEASYVPENINGAFAAQVAILGSGFVGALSEVEYGGAKTQQDVLESMTQRRPGSNRYWRLDGPESLVTGAVQGDPVWVDVPERTLGTDLPANASSYIHTTPLPGTTYTYCVQALGQGEVTSASVCSQGATTIPPPVIQTDAAPVTGTLFRNGVGFENFSRSVALHENAAVFGTDNNAAYFSVREEGTWGPLQRVENSGGFFGEGVALWGDYALVTDPLDDEATSFSAGAVYVYRRDGNQWTQEDKLFASDAIDDARFGSIVTMYEDQALITAYNADDEGLSAVYVFKLENEVWTQQAKLISPEQSFFDGFGVSVAIRDDLAVVGSPQQNSSTGAVYVFRRDGGGAWGYERKLTAFDAAAGDFFGGSVALNDAYIMVGARGENDSKGAAYVFRVDGQPVARLIPTRASMGTEDEAFGQSIAMTEDHAVIGASLDDEAAINAGAAYLYRLRDTTWVEIAKLLPRGVIGNGNTQDAPNFGDDVALSGDDVLIGAFNFGLSPSQTGAAFTQPILEKPANVQATHGSYTDRIQVTWSDRSLHEDGFAIYRTNAEGALQVVGTVEAGAETFDDLTAVPGGSYAYCVVATNTALGVLGDEVKESPPTCATGWRPPNGRISGRVATRAGAGTPEVEVCLAPNQNRALLLDGTGGYVQPVAGPDRAGPDLAGQDFTIEFWMQRASTDKADWAVVQGAELQNQGLHIGFLLTNSFIFGFYGNDLAVGTDNYVNDAAWHHWAVTYDADTRERKIYQDTVLVAQDVATSSYIGSGAIGLGRWIDTLSDDAFALDYLQGQLDEVRIWRGVRTAEEIGATMMRRLRGSEAGLLGYWPFDEGEGTVTADVTGSGYNGQLEGGTYWAEEGPFDVCADTNLAGNYTLADIRYGTATTFTLTPSRPGRVFEPSSKQLTLATESPVQNEIGFTDVTAFTFAGTVEYVDAFTDENDTGGGTCAVEGVQLFVDDAYKLTTEEDGRFVLSLDPSDPQNPDDTRTIRPEFDDHDFDPPAFDIVATESLFGQDIADLTRNTLSGYFGGSCGTDIGTATVRIFTEDGCYDRTLKIPSGDFEIELPPLNYLVEVQTVETDSPLRADIVQFFQNLGAVELDMTGGDVQRDFLYRAPIAVTIAGLADLVPNQCSTINVDETERVLPVVPVLPASSAPIPLTISVVEDYGDGVTCPVDAGTVNVFDAIADRGEPLTLTIQDGEAVYAEDVVDEDGTVLIEAGSPYATVAGAPNTLAGARVDGVDRSYQKAITAIGQVEGRPAVTATRWAIVEGMRERTASFVSATTDPIPMLVLHDPPGSNSYAYVEAGTTVCERISNMKLGDFGLGNDIEVAVGLVTENGLGLSVEAGAGLTYRARTIRGFETTELTTGFCGGNIDFGESLAFSLGIPSPALFAPNEDCDGDPRASNLEICMTTTERITTSDQPVWTGEDLFMGVALNLKFAEADNLNVDAEQCTLALTAALAGELEDFETTYVYGETHIRESLLPALEELQTLEGAPSELEGTLGDENLTLTYDEAIETWNGHLAASEQLTELGLQGQCQVIGDDGVVSEGDCPQGYEPLFPVENRSFSGGASYEYSVRQDTTRIPYLKSSRVHFTNEGGAGAIAVLAGLENLDLISWTGSKEYISSKDSTLTDTRLVGYVLADDDPGDFFSVDIGTDPEYRTPVFGLRSGRSSNPWEPGWPSECRTLDDVTASGEACTSLARTQRRDNLELSIFPPELRNVPPDQEGTFTLSLSNDSESQEQREYTLHIAKPENPKSLFMSITGDPIDGEVFLIKPGQTQEITLQVARGQTPNFAYSYENVAMYAYPQREYELWQMDPRQPFVLSDTAFFSVYFDAPCSEIDILQPQDLWALNATSPTLDFILDGFTIPVSETDTVATVGLQYRRAGAGDEFGTSWLPVGAISRGDLGDDATSWSSTWTPAQDGDYEIRAFTECQIAGPGKRVFSGTVSGIVDTVAPEVLGTPRPAGEVLTLGEEVGVTFNEVLDCGSVVTKGAATNAVLAYADGSETGTEIPIEAVCGSESLSFTPDLGWDLYENRLLTMTLYGSGNTQGDGGTEVGPLTDAAGNPLARQPTGDGGSLESVRWSFVVQRSAFAWQPTHLSPGYGPAMQATLVNGRSREASFTLEDIPAYLTPSRTSAVLPARGQQVIDFAVDLTADLAAMLPDTLRATTPEGDALLILECRQPGWFVSSGSYAYSMTLTTELSIEGVAATGPGYLVAAFVGEDLRGVAPMDEVSERVTLPIYSNLATGETVRFEVWDGSSCLRYPGTDQTVTFNAGTTPGSDAPLTLNATFNAPLPQTIVLNQGWTWFSFNRDLPNTGVSDVLLPAQATGGDLIKSQAAFSLFDQGTGSWVGALPDLSTLSSYQVKLGAPTTLSIPGAPVEPTTPITIVSGWNWIGYLPHVALPIDDALASLSGTATAGDLIKSQTQFASFDGTNWVGSLTQMVPGQGYLLNSVSAGTLTYPAATAAQGVEVPTVLTLRADAAHEGLAAVERGAEPGRKVVPHSGDGTEPEEHDPAEAPLVSPAAYAHSMTLIGTVILDDEPLLDEDAQVWLTDENGTIRGNASLQYVDALQDYRLFLMFYSDMPQGESFEVHVQHPSLGEVVTLEHRLNFKADHRAGTVAEPVLIVGETEAFKAAKAAAEIPETYSLDQNYPNPFNPTTAIRYGLPEASEVRLIVYDVLGREVMRLVDGAQQAGWHTVSFDGRSLASGMYLYRIEAGAFKQVQTMMLVK